MSNADSRKISAFNMLEILVALVIFGITSFISVSYYQRYLEKMRAKTSEFNLVAIHDKELRYKIDNNDYFLCPAPCPVATLNAGLGLQITDRFFTYTIDLRAGSAIRLGYFAQATRNASNGTLCNGKVMMASDITSNVTKGCTYW